MWVFPSVLAADESALVQYGDPILGRPDDIRRFYSVDEIVRLLPEAPRHLSLSSPAVLRDASSLDKIWRMMHEAARNPPGPDQIVAIVAQDRRLTRQGGVQVRTGTGDRSMDDVAAVAAEKPKKEKKARAPKAERTTPINTSAKFSDTSVISFGKDKEGKDWGPENNPKRPNSATWARFKLYQSGMTLKEAMDAGVTRGDINWDSKQGFIILT